jgi:hypothetical protein
VKIKIYRTLNMPVVLLWCENCSLKLREIRRLRLFEKRVLSISFGPKRVNVIGK